MKIVGWKPTGRETSGYVMEYEGQLATGPFATKEKAVDWFRTELDVDISIQGESDANQEADEEQHAESESTTEDTEYTDGKGPTETWVGHCPGCAASR